eukprot:GILK01006735.1.p1 GENE.GILK01006735.1~~GILK01006735.1.p1  ORF type:complete len:464 (+),score=35.21 GILK01006735.1:52-1392(+)
MENTDEKMEEALSCAVCLDLYKEPVSLDCLHKLCLQCALDICRSKFAGRARRASAPQDFSQCVIHTDWVLSCPTCRQPTKLAAGLTILDFFKMRLDKWAKSVIEVYRQALEPPTKRRKVDSQSDDSQSSSFFSQSSSSSSSSSSASSISISSSETTLSNYAFEEDAELDFALSQIELPSREHAANRLSRDSSRISASSNREPQSSVSSLLDDDPEFELALSQTEIPTAMPALLNTTTASNRSSHIPAATLLEDDPDFELALSQTEIPTPGTTVSTSTSSNTASATLLEDDMELEFALSQVELPIPSTPIPARSTTAPAAQRTAQNLSGSLLRDEQKRRMETNRLKALERLSASHFKPKGHQVVGAAGTHRPVARRLDFGDLVVGGDRTSVPQPVAQPVRNGPAVASNISREQRQRMEQNKQQAKAKLRQKMERLASNRRVVGTGAR